MRAADKRRALLFTPGPLTTSAGVKEAMLEDRGSRDQKFVGSVRHIRSELLRIAHVSDKTHSTVIIQGSGTFGVESVISSAIAKDDKLLVIANGAYGQRIKQIAAVHHISHQLLEFGETEVVDMSRIAKAIQDYAPTHLAVVHCETTTGLINPIEAIGELCEKSRVSLIVDAMSSFGGIEIDLSKLRIDFLISSSNKCLQGVPGFSFVIAKLDALRACEGRSRTLTLDLYAQWKGLEKDSQFRFTPPTHVLLAFEQALMELKAEGGISQRQKRYEANHQRVLEGMTRLGFAPLLPADKQGPIITSFLYPEDPSFEFEIFYRALNQRGVVIYPGKVSKASCFRIGHIGDLFAPEMDLLLKAVAEVIDELQLRLNA